MLTLVMSSYCFIERVPNLSFGTWSLYVFRVWTLFFKNIFISRFRENHVAAEEGIENRYNSLRLWPRKWAELIPCLIIS